jgi:glycogen(starch) synthase
MAKRGHGSVQSSGGSVAEQVDQPAPPQQATHVRATGGTGPTGLSGSVSASKGSRRRGRSTPASPVMIETPVASPPDAASNDSVVDKQTPEPPAPTDTPPPSRPPEPEPVPMPPLLFEVGWEVCWQLGGIYTVLKTKAESMLARWHDDYCLVGPYNPVTAAGEFEETPAEGMLAEALRRLRDRGVNARHGRWLVKGRPRVVLIDHRSRYGSLDTDKYLMWADHGISVPAGDGEVNDVIAFGFAATEFFRAVSEVAGKRQILAHFHEWMAGVAVPRIAHLRIPVTTVFTTHATLLGRYLAGDNPYFYDHLPFFNADAEAAKYQILPRHLIEKAAAHASVVFTTVSQVTSFEAEKLLARRPDFILPNGLDIRRFEAPHEFQHLHSQYKDLIHQFVMGHFFPGYSFDLDRTLYFFTAGRYEYRNKGIDLYIESLARLNERLKQQKDPPTVIGFIVTRAPTKNINVDVLRSQIQYDELRRVVGEIRNDIGRRMFSSVARGSMPDGTDLLTDDAKAQLKRAMAAWRTGRQPYVVTHDMVNDADDPTMKHIRARQLFNSPHDPVKIVFHPEFVTATSPLIHLDYEQFVRGCHLGVFPSYYEPWGYTPMECVALGVPSVTTDLSGFGAYVQQTMPDIRENGVVTLNRRTASFDQAADELVQYMLNLCGLSRRQRIELRNRVEKLSERFDWDVLVKHYHEAHDAALLRVAGRVGRLEVRTI